MLRAERSTLSTTPNVDVLLAPSQETHAEIDRAPRTRAARIDGCTLLFGLWLALAGAGCARACLSWRRIAVIRRDSLPLVDPAPLREHSRRAGLAKAPELRVASVTSPLLTGSFAPAILVPTDLAATATPEQWGWIFAHEVAHIRRGDIAWSWMHSFVCSLFFFSPLVWLTRREWFLTQEIACDADAIRMMASPRAEYARSRADEIERQRAILRTMVEAQHQALLQGKHPSASDQTLAIRKEREIKEMEAQISDEVVNRLAPKLGAVLTRKQFARACQLVHGKTPAGESQRAALYDPESGFVLPELESMSLREELVRSMRRSS